VAEVEVGLCHNHKYCCPHYGCSSSGSCTPATVPINPVGSAAPQAQNPISQFSADSKHCSISGSGSITFAIKNANTLFATSNTVFNNLAGPGVAGGNFIGSFDWGLPFYLGRTIYTSISGQSVSGYSGATPFVAF